MNAAFVRASLMKDLSRRLHDPWSLVFWLAIPLVIVSLILLAFGGQDGTPPKAKILVVDHDGSFVSQLLVQAMGNAEVIETETVTEDLGRKRIEDGKASALLTIPSGFGQAVIDDTPAQLQLLTNPAQRILPGIAEQMLRILTDAAFYLQRLFGEELRTLAGGPPEGAKAFPNATVAQVSTRINERMGRLSTYLFPPKLEVNAKVESTRSEPSPGLGTLFFPGVLFMALLFMASGIASDVWIEKESGTLRRMVSTPQRMADFLAGKVLSGAALMGAVSLIALLIATVSFGVALADVPLGVLWATFSGAVFLLLIMLIQLHASSARTAGVFTTMLIFPLLMVGGSFFPFESMPAGLATIGRMTPNGWALMQLKAILWGGIDGASLAIAFGVLLAIALLAFSLSAARMRGRFVTG